ncbi:MAG: hypothetical protein WC560_08580, partial [Syntrophales bacterium]
MKYIILILFLTSITYAQVISTTGTSKKSFGISNDSTENAQLRIGVPLDTSRHGAMIVRNGGELGNKTFLNGWQSGKGWKIAYDDTTKEYNLTVDNIVIRGTLQALEFLVNQTRGENGNLLVTS